MEKVKSESEGRGRGRRGWEIQERDEEIVRWLGRHRLATAEQVMRRFGMHRAKAYARLGVLCEAGLVRFEPGIRSKRVYLATRAGLIHSGLALKPATVAPASFAHDLAVVDAAVELELRFEGLVVSEREMRASERREEYQLREPGSGAVMWPDLVLEHGGGCAVEVELTLKSKERLRSKMLAYCASRYSAVIYRVHSRAVEAAVLEAGRHAALGDRLRIERTSSGCPQDPASTREASAQPDLLGVNRQLQSDLAAARIELDALAEGARRSDGYARLMANEVIAFLDAGRQQRGEIMRRWEREFATLRAPSS